MLRRPPRGPKYLREKRLKGGSLAYYWAPPTWAVTKGCGLRAEALGSGYTNAVERCEFLNRAFVEWRTGRKEDDDRPAPFTLDWLFAEYRGTRKFQRLKSRRETESALALVGKYKLANGVTLGRISLEKITRLTAQRLYDKLVVRSDRTLRATHINGVMRCVRAAWNVVGRLHPEVPKTNPFATLDQERPEKTGGVKPATFAQLMQFVAAADALGLSSIGTAALIGFDFALREPDIVASFSWSDWRPPETPGHALIRHGKTREQYLLPVEDADGIQLYPELESRFAATPRRGPLVVMQDQPDRNRLFKPHTVHGLRRLVRRIRERAELPASVSFASFRKGGMTEMGEARLSDQQIISLSGHKTRQMVSVYSKATDPLRIEAAKQRRLHRHARLIGTDRGLLSE